MTIDTEAAEARRRARGVASPVGLAALIFAVAAGPLAWFVQLNVNYGLDSHPCYPHEAPRAHPLPGWEGVGTALFAINLAAIVLALGGTWLSYRLWQASRGRPAPRHNDVLPPAVGRARFLAASGLLMGPMILAALICDLVSLATVPPCPG